MAKLYLVRHGRALAGFGEFPGPGLDAAGSEQARTAAEMLAPFGPLPIISSPMARAQETAEPLANRWRCRVRIEPAVAEIPSPAGDTQERVLWLRQFMGGSWREASLALAQWRESAIAALVSLQEDTIVFTHYVAINVAVGAALGDERVVVFSPDNASITIIDNEGGRLTLVQKGREAPLTKVN